MAESSGIEARYCVISDYVAASPDEFTFFPRSWRLDPFPTTRQRMQVYEREVVPLAANAATRALDASGVAPAEVTHLIISTCTGFFAPGPDVLLLSRLGLNGHVQRQVIGFMGCYAGINAIRAADQIVRSDPRATVLHVSAEICSLHFQREQSIRNLVANTIFADGASAAVYRSEERAEGAGLASISGTGSLVEQDSLEKMRWDIGDHGFVMHLAVDIPHHLETGAGRFLRQLLDRARIDPESIVGYAIHPGGKRVIEAVTKGLDLELEAASSALSVLREFGNMSSATILFVLERELAKVDRSGHVLAVGFGPGLTIEGVTLEV